MKLYLAGPMTGIKDFNYPAFNRAAKYLRSLRHSVFNPAEEFEGIQGMSFSKYLKHDIPMLLECDGIVLLPGYLSSVGAQLEHVVAIAAGLQRFAFRPDSRGGELLELPEVTEVRLEVARQFGRQHLMRVVKPVSS